MTALHSFKVGDLVHGKDYHPGLTRGTVRALLANGCLDIYWANDAHDFRPFHYNWLKHLSPLEQLAETAE